MLVFASPQFFKYSSLLTFGSTSLKTLEWGHVANLLQSNTKRHSQTFRTFFRLTPILRSHICVFPDVAHHQATLSNLTKTPAFTVGLTPLSGTAYKLSYPLYVFHLSFSFQTVFLNLLRVLNASTTAT